MRRYELTERGKIILAVVVVVLLLVIPGTILALKTVAARSPESAETSDAAVSPDKTPPAETSDNKTPDTSDTTPSDSSQPPAQSPAPVITPESPDANHDEPVVSSPSDTSPDTSADTPTPAQTQDSPPEQAHTPAHSPEPPATETKTPESDPERASLDGGRLSFIFTPSSQTGISDAADDKLEEFLKNPKNTDNYMITVETPLISESDARTLMRAITEALSKRGVKSSRLEHIAFPPAALGNTVDVKMYYVPIQTK